MEVNLNAQTPQLSCVVDQLRLGQMEPFGPNGESSAINKQLIAGEIYITKLGLKGDQQADKRFHGGLSKAVHHFPAEHYSSLKALLPDITAAVGGFGENISTLGMTEKDVCLGDVFRLGTTVLQLSQGRQPCWKLNVRFDYPDMANLIQQQGWTGWYYSVVEEGHVVAGDRLVLLERPYPQASLAELQHYLYCDPLNRTALEQLLLLPVLPERWRQTFMRRLETGNKESDVARICTPLS